ncbi:R27A [Hepatospora eriocheir]|uniref:R27A n=1 Tax=Hepatospora eriocheir TaxID=1081669 RepID=A0A1X0QIZ9_9MICR|nr:R27A [Hepatospora eriocheir]
MHKDKKSRKMRGKTSHGYGRTNKHRKHPSGRGACGGFKHMRTWYMKYHPDFFGKRGMLNFHVKKNAEIKKSISLAKVYGLMDSESRKEVLNNESISPVIDVREFGYHVVVAGELPLERPLVVKARYFTKNAEQQIANVGGKAIICS